MNRSKWLAFFNLIVLLSLIFWNYYSNSGTIGGETVASISRKYDNLFTPAGYAFAIWGLIYLSLVFQAARFAFVAFSNKEEIDFILTASPWLILANVGNVLWLWFWLNDSIGISLLIMAFIFTCLLVAVIRLNMERWDAPVVYMATVWWPIDLYVGWISIALTANVAVFLTAEGFDGAFLSEANWTALIIVAATLIHLFMVWTRNMREFAAVGIWAFVAIAVRHWGDYPVIVWTALICSAILLLYNFYHAYLHKETLPILGSESKWS